MPRVNTICIASQEGFWYHHAEPNYLMLVNWLPQGTHTLPENASHRVVIGAFVMNKNREVLSQLHVSLLSSIMGMPCTLSQILFRVS